MLAHARRDCRRGYWLERRCRNLLLDHALLPDLFQTSVWSVTPDTRFFTRYACRLPTWTLSAICITVCSVGRTHTRPSGSKDMNTGAQRAAYRECSVSHNPGRNTRQSRKLRCARAHSSRTVDVFGRKRYHFPVAIHTPPSPDAHVAASALIRRAQFPRLFPVVHGMPMLNEGYEVQYGSRGLRAVGERRSLQLKPARLFFALFVVCCCRERHGSYVPNP